MARRIPSSFRIALAIEEAEWNKPFRNALDRSHRKKFNEEIFFDISRLYASQFALLCCSACQDIYPMLVQNPCI